MLLLLACADPAPKSPPPDGLTADGATLTLVEAGTERLRLDATALGDGELSVALAVEGDLVTPTVTAGSAGATFTALTLSGTWSLDGDAVHVRQGYQSWSWSGALDLEPVELTDAGLPAVEGDGDTWTVATETPWTSWWAGRVAVPEGDSLLLAATSATRTKFWTAFGPSEAWAVWGGRGEAILLGPGESLVLDAMLVAETEAEWAAAVPGRARTDTPPVGWSDWYRYYGDTSEALLLAELAAAPDAVEVFQVDDGWERAWGDWTANEAFPAGTDGLAAAIAATGRTPGLWMAPLYVETSTSTYTDHPDWWVRGDDGEPLVHGSLLGKDLVILDVTEPEAAAWLGDVLADKVAEGWTYLKLDFLYAGAVEGRRHADVTGVQAYAEAMRIAREAMGESTFFLACGAPMLPSVGWADSWRSGADIAYDVHPDPDLALLRWQARNTAARAFANGVWWWNDADAVLLRAPLDEAGARASLAAGVASGGAWFGGDSLTEGGEAAYDAGLIALLGPTPEVDVASAVSGFDAGPLAELGDPDDAVPVTWRVGDATVLLNLGDAPVDVTPPGGTELLAGAPAGTHALAPGDAEVWATQ